MNDQTTTPNEGALSDDLPPLADEHEATTVEEPVPVYEKQNFTVVVDISQPSTGSVDAATSVDLPIPSSRSSVAIQALTEKVASINVGEARTESYVTQVVEAGGLSPKTGGLEAAIDRPGADWANSLQLGAAQLRPGFPSASPTATLATPEARRAATRKAMGLGNWATVPLWHSGFWLSLSAPTEGELLELNRVLAETRASIGRQTYGLMYSADIALTQHELCKFAMDHLYETNLKDSQTLDLFEQISMLDLPLIVNCLASSVWPSGFRMRRYCVADPEKCRHEVAERVSIPRTLFVDRSRFTDSQLRQMAERTRNSITTDRVASYQTGGHVPTVSSVRILDLVVHFKIPNLKEYFGSAMRWAADIETTYGSALTHDERARADVISSHQRATQLRNWTHLVSAVQVGETILNDRADIETTLSDMSSSDNHVRAFTEAAKKFIDDAVSALVAIPTYDCPACGKPQPVSNPESKYPELIPIDPMQAFFSLLHQKLSRYQAD